jgi:hypothetical protein
MDGLRHLPKNSIGELSGQGYQKLSDFLGMVPISSAEVPS